MAESYQTVQAALKLQVTDQFSFGFIYDQPFGSKAKYSLTPEKLPNTLPPAAAAFQDKVHSIMVLKQLALKLIHKIYH
jgi:long-chain fatty acid transport protein